MILLAGSGQEQATQLPSLAVRENNRHSGVLRRSQLKGRAGVKTP